MHRWVRAGAGIALALLATVNCAAPPPATPVDDRGRSVRHPASTYRTVRAGDTLYSIAWESGRDYRDLATWNGLAPPYTIRPGQKLRLYGRHAKMHLRARHVVVKGDTLSRIARAAGVTVQDLVAWNGLAPPYRLTPGQILRVSSPGTPNTSTAVVATPVLPVIAPGKRNWVWPTNGKMAKRFLSGGRSKGIDIAGEHGQAILAASAGKVVYVGSGLRGYGRLIIVQHDADILSAYAHCAATHVNEGGVVQVGQKIADMGNSGTDQVKLHFEIRRRGIPVDPLDYLPKK